MYAHPYSPLNSTSRCLVYQYHMVCAPNNTSMAGFGLDPFQVDFGRLFYVGTEITIVIKVIKKAFYDYTP